MTIPAVLALLAILAFFLGYGVVALILVLAAVAVAVFN